MQGMSSVTIWDSPWCTRYVTSRSPYHLPNFSHPTALHAPTTSINTKPFGPILKCIEIPFIHEQSLIGIASQPKPLTVHRPTISDSGSQSSPHSVQRSLHQRDIPLWKFRQLFTRSRSRLFTRCQLLGNYLFPMSSNVSPVVSHAQLKYTRQGLPMWQIQMT